jgi:hypothetical protein
MESSLVEAVWHRAEATCEYCRLPQAQVATLFEVDHIIARQHGGSPDLGNLALACIRCNKRKGPNLAGIDPESGAMVRLFNPRTDEWGAHFVCIASRIEGLTPIGRATVAVLGMNQAELVVIRQELRGLGTWPPA